MGIESQLRHYAAITPHYADTDWRNRGVIGVFNYAITPHPIGGVIEIGGIEALRSPRFNRGFLVHSADSMPTERRHPATNRATAKQGQSQRLVVRPIGPEISRRPWPFPPAVVTAGLRDPPDPWPVEASARPPLISFTCKGECNDD